MVDMPATLAPDTGPSVIPLRWSTDAPRHIASFTIRVPDVEGARSHRGVFVDSAGVKHEVTGSGGDIDLAPVWDALATGHVRGNATVEFEDGSSRNIGYGLRFVKGTDFAGWQPIDPATSYDEVIDAVYDVLTSHEHHGEHDPSLPPFVWHGVLEAERRELDSHAYPGLHYSFYLDFLRAYARARPERAEEAIGYARLLIDTTNRFVTPDDYAWPRYPYSTISRGHMGGEFAEGDTIQPLKAAMWATGLLRFAEHEERPDAFETALHIGRELARHQLPSGGIGFRVDARTGEPQKESDESTSLVFALELWRQLRDAGEAGFDEPIAAATRWLLEGPVADNQWISDYDDVPSSLNDSTSKNYNNLDALATAQYLLSHTDEDPEHLERARRILRWVEDGFVFWAVESPVDFLSYPCPAVMEQCSHYYPIDFHLANFALAQFAFYEHTGEEEHLAKARACCAALTHYLSPEGLPLTYAPDPDVGYGLKDHIWLGCAAWTGHVLLTEGARSEEVAAR